MRNPGQYYEVSGGYCEEFGEAVAAIRKYGVLLTGLPDANYEEFGGKYEYAG